MKGFIVLFMVVSSAVFAEDSFIWLRGERERLEVHCLQRGVVQIKSFDSELQIIERVTGDQGCLKFNVVHINEDDASEWLKNVHVNATIYAIDRLKRSPSTLVDWSFFEGVIYPLKLWAIRVQTKRIGRKLTDFLEHGKKPFTESSSKEYFRLFVDQAQVAYEDYLTLSR